MFFKKALLLALCLIATLPSRLAQAQGRRSEIEDSLQSRYRVTTLGGGVMGVHGENSIRRAGGVVVLVRDGLYGAFERGRLASNAIQNGKASVLSGDKDVALAQGEKFYVTSVYVGSDVVSLGLLSTRMISGNNKASQVWASINYFLSKEILEQGDSGRVYPVTDQWLLPEGAGAPTPAAQTELPSSPPPQPAAVSRTAVDLKAGMTRDEIVSALGSPLQEVGFGENQWLTYPSLTITLKQGKLEGVERSAQALVPVHVTSDPDAADVYVDGSFVSSTPAVLRLPTGTYKIVVKMSGYAAWDREVKILPGAEVRLVAKLSK
jgi:hypothetical protein